MAKNIYTINELNQTPPWEGKKITLAGGCFDLLHYGHVLFLENAKKQADVLIILLECDEFIKSKKGRQPIHTQAQRAHILSSMRAVDYVIQLPLLTNNAEYMELVKQIKPAIIAVTDKDTFIQVKEKQAQEVGAEIKVVAPLVEPFSSSQILAYENILSG